MRETRNAWALVFALALVAAGKTQAAPDLIPSPHFYQETGETFIAEGRTLFIPPDNRQCEIAAEEITLRVKELGGKPGTISRTPNPAAPGIFVLTVKDKAAGELAAKLGTRVSETDPGPQGYIISATKEQLVVIGCDNLGALYGAMTVRQMLRGDGAVGLAAAIVRDWPDFAVRGGISMWRGIERLAATGGGNALRSHKEQLDWMARFKMNVLQDYVQTDPRMWSQARRDFYREINAYAVERGILPMLEAATWVYGGGVEAPLPLPNGKTRKDWPCVSDSRPWGEWYHCWSDDAATRARAEATANAMADYHFKILYMHPVDGGGIDDPESWSKRCAKCRERWKDDERWKATLHQLQIWDSIVSAKVPDARFVALVYPYSADYFGVSAQDSPKWRLNARDYMTEVYRRLPPSLYAYTWMPSGRETLDRFRSLYCKGRPTQISDCYPDDLGVFSTYSRFFVTVLGDRRDMISSTGANILHQRWMSYLNAAEFAWNAYSPGCEERAPGQSVYACERDNSGPEPIVKEWLPRACRLFWGEAMAPDMAAFYGSGVLPRYILSPAATISAVNRYRKDPLADTDPFAKKKEKRVSSAAAEPPLVDDAERMRVQAEIAERCVKALDAALPHSAALSPLKRALFAQEYRRAPYWLAIAQAHYATRLGDAALKDGDVAKAVGIYRQAIATYRENLAKAKTAFEKVKTAPDPAFGSDLNRFSELQTANTLKKQLERKLESAEVVLQPRRPGRFVKIGVFAGSGAKGTLDFFERFANVKAERVDDLSLKTLDRFDCVFMLNSTAIDRFDYFQNLRDYVVKGGGGVLFEHALCGNKRFDTRTPFPEICRNAPERRELFSRKILAAAENPLLAEIAPGTEFQCMYVDFFEPVPGKDAFAVAVDPDKRTVAVAGKVGLGKVVFDGAISLAGKNGTYDCEDKELSGFNAMLAEKAVEWFTGVKLEPKHE